MLGNFKYHNPTKLYFGEDSLKYLKRELDSYGKKILLTYGGGSIKTNGIYESVVSVLKECNKEIIELSGVPANPTVEKLYEGAALARENNVDLILAVGGGSVIDYAKGVSVSAFCEEDPWTKYYLNQGNPDKGLRIVPVGCILTMVGTGSEMNGGSVITNHEQKLKIGKVFGSEVMPKFTILNPLYTFSVPQRQMVAGIFDIMSHLMEQYFSNEDDNTTDYIAEGLMRSLISSSLKAVEDNHNYEARSNIMWCATWALNTLLKMGKSGDWEVHMIGQAMGAVTDATHGMTLASVSLPYYKHIMNDGLHKFVRFAKAVWEVNGAGKSDVEIANEGLNKLEEWMKTIGVCLHSSELGVTEENIDDIVKGTFLLNGGYRTLTAEEVKQILRESM
ncbi:MAG: iron-containing alcohol dehydrogenase [Bacteroidales bacterium]|nr:iron-containing alcohol dehydrogenase [Bacteroidales bacterium]